MTSTESFIDNMPTRSINLFLWCVIILFSIVLCGFLLVERPDIVQGKIKLVANNQPFELLAPQAGKLILLKRPNEPIGVGQDIAYVSSPTDYGVVNDLITLLNKRNYYCIYNQLKNDQVAKKMGLLSNSCMNLRSIIYKYMTYDEKSLFAESKTQLESEIAALDKQIDLKKQFLDLGHNAIKVAQLAFIEDSMLYSKGVVTKMDYERSYKTLLGQKEHLLEAENILLTYNREKTIKVLKLSELTVDNVNSRETLRQEIEQGISSLQNDIQIWCRQYVISSPIDGKMELIASVEERQFVKQDAPVIRILPNDEDVVGQVMITTKESNGICKNSQVKVYLDSYPDAQNGYLLGSISDISSSVYTVQTGESFFWAKVSIDFKQQPSFHGKFQFVHGMTGRVEIIIKEKNLMTQICNILSTNMSN